MRGSTDDPSRVDAAALRAWPLPPPGDSKYSRGDVLVVGGSRGAPGAAMLAGIAALRAGAGRLTIAVADSVAVAVAVAVPESAVVGLPEDADGHVRGDAVERLGPALEAADAVLIGPGLDDLAQTGLLLDGMAPAIGAGTAVCLDAFALGALAKRPGWGGDLERLMLTPNKEEAAILLGHDIEGTLAAAREVASRYRATAACYEFVSDSDGRAWRTRPGGAGLGTSGSGDVRAGIIAGLLARGADGPQAAAWGSSLHALAGERLADRVGGLGYLAGELAGEVPAIMAGLEPD